MEKTGGAAHHDAPSFHIRKREAIGNGIARAIGEQLQSACKQLHSTGERIDQGIHEARKGLKKSRALLRLIRPALGGNYIALNAELRDAGRRLSGLRDAEAVAETARRLRQQSHEGAANQILDAADRLMVERKERIVGHFLESRELAEVANSVKETAGRIRGESLRRVNALMIAEGVAETVRRGRKAFAVARESRDAGDFHEWRKRAKDLRYQIGFLERLWPHVLKGYAESARDVEQSLGEDHNLSVLRGMVTAEDAELPGLESLLAVVDAEQQRLREQAERIGTLLYNEKPKHWAKRITCAWNRR